jgi:hypothetical protein
VARRSESSCHSRPEHDGKSSLAQDCFAAESPRFIHCFSVLCRRDAERMQHAEEAQHPLDNCDPGETYNAAAPRDGERCSGGSGPRFASRTSAFFSSPVDGAQRATTSTRDHAPCCRRRKRCREVRRPADYSTTLTGRNCRRAAADQPEPEHRGEKYRVQTRKTIECGGIGPGLQDSRFPQRCAGSRTDRGLGPRAQPLKKSSGVVRRAC